MSIMSLKVTHMSLENNFTGQITIYFEVLGHIQCVHLYLSHIKMLITFEVLNAQRTVRNWINLSGCIFFYFNLCALRRVVLELEHFRFSRPNCEAILLKNKLF